MRFAVGSMGRFLMRPILPLLAFGFRILQESEKATVRGTLGSCGRGTVIDEGCAFLEPGNIHIGEDVYIGSGALFSAVNTRITIGNKVMFGPQVGIIAGDHNTSVVGRAMKDVRDKRPQDDLPVVIEDDVWIGFRAVILKGVTICRGSIIGACTVLTRDVPPYSVVAGVPGRVIRPRFTPGQIAEHESRLGPEEKGAPP